MSYEIQKTNAEIRTEILKKVGVHTERYIEDRRNNFTEDHLRKICEHIQSGTTSKYMSVRDLLVLVCKLSGTTFESYKTRRHGLDREKLKAIYMEMEIHEKAEETLEKHQKMRQRRVKELENQSSS